MAAGDILKPPNSSSLQTLRAADWAVQVDTTDGSGTPTWVFVNGISKFEPTNDPTLQDDTDINAGGYKSQLVTAQSLDVNLEGLIKGTTSSATFTADPGCDHIRQCGKKIGYENVVHLRFWRTDGMSEAFEHYFAASWKDTGGSNEDLQKFTCDLKGRGKPTSITKPTEGTP